MKISITTECFYRLGIMLGLALGNAYIGYAITEVVMYRYFTKMYAAVFVQILNLNTN